MSIFKKSKPNPLSPQANRIRVAILAVLGAAVGLGLLPQDVLDLIESNAEAIVGGVLALWAIVAGLRNRKDSKNGAQ